MAKKQKKEMITLMCTVCKERNYVEIKGNNVEGKFEKTKFCSNCRKHQPHKEAKAS